MKALTIEEMKEIGAGAECSAGFSCMGGGCWREVETEPGWKFWVRAPVNCC